MILIHTLAWIPMVFIAIANGAARDLGYRRYFTELRAHQISTLSGTAIFTLYVAALQWRWPLKTYAQAMVIGVIWLVLTIAFEFGFGRYVRGLSWKSLATDYDVRKGRVWALFLGWLAVLPVVIHRLRA